MYQEVPKMDPWDELLHSVGQGWPHYKDIARPLIDPTNHPTTRRRSKKKEVLICTLFISLLLRHSTGQNF